MNIHKNIYFKSIAVTLIVTMLASDVTWANPDGFTRNNSTLAPYTIFQQQFRGSILNNVRLVFAVENIADYLLGGGNPEKALPLEHLAYVMRKEEEAVKAKIGALTQGIDLDNVQYNTDRQVIEIPFTDKDKHFIIQVTPVNNPAAKKLIGYEWLVSDRYAVKVVPEGYQGEAEHPKAALPGASAVTTETVATLKDEKSHVYEELAAAKKTYLPKKTIEADIKAIVKTGAIEGNKPHRLRDILDVTPQEILGLMRAQFVREHSARIMAIGDILVDMMDLPEDVKRTIRPKVRLAAAGHDFDSPVYPTDRKSASTQAIIDTLRAKGIITSDKCSAGVDAHEALRQRFAGAKPGEFTTHEMEYALDIYTGPSAIYGMREKGISCERARTVEKAIVFHHNIDELDADLADPKRAEDGWTDDEKNEARLILSILVGADIIENGMNLFKKIACRNQCWQEAPEKTLRFFPPEIDPRVTDAYRKLINKGDQRFDAIRKDAVRLTPDERDYLTTVGRDPVRVAIVAPRSLATGYGKILLQGFEELNAPRTTVDLLVPEKGEDIAAFAAAVKKEGYDVVIAHLHGAHNEDPVAFEDYGTKTVMVVHRTGEAVKRLDQGFYNAEAWKRAFAGADGTIVLGRTQIGEYQKYSRNVSSIPHGFTGISAEPIGDKHLDAGVAIGSRTMWSEMRRMHDVIALVKETRKDPAARNAFGYIAGMFLPYKDPATGETIDEAKILRSSPDCVFIRAGEIDEAYQKQDGFNDLPSLKQWLLKISDNGKKVIIVEGDLQNKDVIALEASLIDFSAEMFHEIMDGFRPKEEYAGALHRNPGTKMAVGFDTGSMRDLAEEGIGVIEVQYKYDDGTIDVTQAAQKITGYIKDPSSYHAQLKKTWEKAQELTVRHVAGKYAELAGQIIGRGPTVDQTVSKMSQTPRGKSDSRHGFTLALLLSLLTAMGSFLVSVALPIAIIAKEFGFGVVRDDWLHFAAMDVTGVLPWLIYISTAVAMGGVAMSIGMSGEGPQGGGSGTGLPKTLLDDDRTRTALRGMVFGELALQKALTDPDEVVHAEGAMSLDVMFKYNPAEAAQLLGEMLTGNDYNAKVGASKRIGAMYGYDPVRAEELLKKYASRNYSDFDDDDDYEIREGAAGSLQYIFAYDPQKALELLDDLLDKTGPNILEGASESFGLAFLHDQYRVQEYFDFARRKKNRNIKINWG
ncbi:MAG: hypothetical protein PHS37_09445, partial [Candidatus Omnitrophica bacterium]|nr:hypothetical protein [Candidatus Omnitrophota bacterium]